jgi:hypothetical protein
MNPRSSWNLGRLCCALAMTVLLMGSNVAKAQSDRDEVMVTLEAVDDSGVSGEAVLTANGDQTDVAIRLTGATGSHPNHIHENFCADVNPEPLFPLTHVNVGEADPDGFTNSTVDVSLDELLDSEFSILVHRSDDRLDEYLACGNIGTPQETTEETAPLPEIAAVPEADATVSGGSDTGEVGPGKGKTGVTVVEVSTSGVGTAARSDVGLLVIVVGLGVLTTGVAFSTARRTRVE